MMESTNDTTLLDFMEDEVEIMKDDRHPAIKALWAHYDKIGVIQTQAISIVIDSKESADAALRLHVQGRDIEEQIEAYRKQVVLPYRRFISSINECATNLKTILENIEGIIKVKLASWRSTQEKRVLEAQESINVISESLGLEVSIIAPEAPKTVSCEVGSAYIREKISFEIEDASKVPDEYWVIDEKAIQTHINLGKKDIPGVKIKIEKIMTIRRK